jgi:hypothetical protein
MPHLKTTASFAGFLCIITMVLFRKKSCALMALLTEEEKEKCELNARYRNGTFCPVCR